MAKPKIIVPDTSVLAEGIVFNYIKDKKLSPKKIIIPIAVLHELEHQANRGRETGYIGLEEITKLRETKNFEVEFSGEKPTEFDIKFAKSGSMDNIIRQVAIDNDATLMTADRVQGIVATSRGINTIFVNFSELEQKELINPLEQFFTDDTMSVHIKEGAKTIAKRGKPGAWDFVELDFLPDATAARNLAKQIVEITQKRTDSFIEIEREGSTILQLENYRTVIVKPPFGSCWEITAVRPVKQLTLDEYEFPADFKHRLEKNAEGILVAGSPGEGKSTFTQALGAFYAGKKKIVKTVEAPRDLVLPEAITQYSISHGSPEEVRDVLLLNRPDYTIYDEIRNTIDFKLFADMRLAGVGMIGVVHATNPVDSIQRFIGRIEMGMIPQIIDTVVFIKAGRINKVYTLQMTVKTPSGMVEEDLARPVILVSDFATKKPEYEIYTFGDNTVVMPYQDDNKKSNPLLELAAEGVRDYFFRYSSHCEVEMLSESRAAVYLPDAKMAQVIGKGGSNIQEIERALGIKLDIRSLAETNSNAVTLQWEAKFAKKNITISLPPNYANTEVVLLDDGQYVLSAVTSKKAQLKISMSSGVGKVIKKALDRDRLEIQA